ncbi:MAG: gliding motility protein [Deltaproteobacteria bacterium]|nr:MAG: gliding motility protein [Deltaproteobacteria bacterium]
MSFLDLSKREVHVKIVYYGPGRGGKTTNLLHIHEAMTDAVRGQMVSIDTKQDRTLFFDFLPLSIGKIFGFDIRIQLFTVPGQVIYNATRKLVLKGVDGVAFIADSQVSQKEKNIESLENLRDNLADIGVDINKIPLVLQFNKQDLAAEGIPLLSEADMVSDLNSVYNVPCFNASALTGEGVFETLREISKTTVKSVARKLMPSLTSGMT